MVVALAAAQHSVEPLAGDAVVALVAGEAIAAEEVAEVRALTSDEVVVAGAAAHVVVAAAGANDVVPGPRHDHVGLGSPDDFVVAAGAEQRCPSPEAGRPINREDHGLGEVCGPGRRDHGFGGRRVRGPVGWHARRKGRAE
jgi:hypothetical protein